MLSLEGYRWLLVAHGAFRWVVVILGFAVVINAMLGLSSGQRWAPQGPKLCRLFGIAVDVQVLMGAALYLTLSPLTTVVGSVAGAGAPRGSDLHFFYSVHPQVMMGVFIAVHVAAVIVRRGRSDVAHQRRAIIFYGLTLLFLLGGIPWWRPWLRW
jgi:hypothetical protein